MIIYVTGGARSGKSRFAEEKVKEIGQSIGYIATAIAFDEGMKDRIRKHQEDRPREWPTFETYKGFDLLLDQPAFKSCDTFLFDCVTIMVTNLMMDSGLDFDTCTMDEVNTLEHEIKSHVINLLDLMEKENKDIVLVSNEVGMGLVPFYKFGNYFRDIAGRMNQLIAARADEVYFAVSGIPVKIK